MAMMAKNLLWSCAQIVAPRPPINPQRPNEAEPATLLHAEDLPTFGHPAPDLLDELRAGQMPGRLQTGVPPLDHSHDEFQMHIQAELEPGFGGIHLCSRQGLARREGARRGRRGSQRIRPGQFGFQRLGQEPVDQFLGGAIRGLVRRRRSGYGPERHVGIEDVCFHKCVALWFD